MTLPSTETVIKAGLSATTYRELQAICIGYKDNDIELFNYYNSFLEWFGLQYKFLRAEALIMIELQNEIWDLDEERMAGYESEKTTPEIKDKWFKQNYFVFEIFGYSFSFILEIGKV